MSLKKQLEALGVGESLITQHQRTGIYTAAKRAGRIVKTEEVEGGIKVTRIDDELPPLASAIVAIQGLPVADRLKVFENFELCCGMNKGGCVCIGEASTRKDEGLGVSGLPLPQQITREQMAQMPPRVDAQDLMGTVPYFAQIVPVPASLSEPTEEWRFTKDKPQFADDGNVYRQQKLAPDFKRSRNVQVDADDHEAIIRVA